MLYYISWKPMTLSYFVVLRFLSAAEVSFYVWFKMLQCLWTIWMSAIRNDCYFKNASICICFYPVMPPGDSRKHFHSSDLFISLFIMLIPMHNLNYTVLSAVTDSFKSISEVQIQRTDVATQQYVWRGIQLKNCVVTGSKMYLKQILSKPQINHQCYRNAYEIKNTKHASCLIFIF